MTALEKILAILEPLTESERRDLLMGIDDVYCVSCGCKQPKKPGEWSRRCQCWNDE